MANSFTLKPTGRVRRNPARELGQRAIYRLRRLRSRYSRNKPREAGTPCEDKRLTREPLSIDGMHRLVLPPDFLSLKAGLRRGGMSVAHGEATDGSGGYAMEDFLIYWRRGDVCVIVQITDESVSWMQVSPAARLCTGIAE